MIGAGAAAPAIARRAAMTIGVLALATALELWVATATSGGRAARLTALTALLTAKAGVVVAALMGARAHRRVAALTLGAMGLAVGFAVVLMLEAAFQARVR
jgi:Na+-translocating ferredoxin:NAD+ oxidoreductase RnfA subunit